MPTPRDFYVVIQTPDELRKNVLEGAKQVIVTLRRYESFRAIRKQKIDELAKFNALASDMSQLMIKAKAALPNIKVTDLPKPEVKAKTPIKDKQVQQQKSSSSQPTIQPVNELDRLELELKKIEGKLKDI